MDLTLANMVFLPIGLGLLGFIEPCSIGSTLLFVKYLEAKDSTAQFAQAVMFAATRAVFIGLLGVLAVFAGDAFLGFQRVAWTILGAVYVLLGLSYAAGKRRMLQVSFAPRLGRLSPLRGSALIGVVFGFNIPACATPLIFALLATAAAGGAAGATLLGGFVSLALFGLALSLPLIAVVLFKPGRRALDRLASLSERLPFWAGLILIALGSWSIWFALFATIKPS